ncbi:hypothetical protein ACXIUH_05620 [Vibrio parahaemolyticus]|nr:hypothetical protein [Vibrio parahaemolyticus]
MTLLLIHHLWLSQSKPVSSDKSIRYKLSQSKPVSSDKSIRYKLSRYIKVYTQITDIIFSDAVLLVNNIII